MATATHNDEGALVFVYGTLMTGEHNHRLLAGAGAAFLGTERTEPAFTLMDLGAFPAAVPGGSTAVAGELYLVDGATLRALDRLEGHPSFYRRATIRLAGGQQAACYVIPADRLPGWRSASPIPGGDWRARREVA